MTTANDLRELLDENQQLREQVETLQLRLRQVTNEVASLSAVVVAGATLHAATDRLSVINALDQIMVNLIGAEKFAIFKIDGGHQALMHCVGLAAEEALECVAGSALVAQTIQSGDTWAAPSEDDDVRACVPILSERRIAAVIVIFDLLPQKRRFVPSDFDVFELITSQAGAVLRAAEMSEKAGIRNDERVGTEY
jgi:cell division septum initiation protein DivIVA